MSYDYDVVRKFAVMTVVWGIFGMAMGVLIATQLVWPEFLASEFTHFGRLRRCTHQRCDFCVWWMCFVCYQLLRRSAPAAQPWRSRLWQVHLLGLAGRHRIGSDHFASGSDVNKEYAELEWPIDILIAVVWVSYAIVFLGTIRNRTTPHIYVANWFYAAFIIVIAVLHIVNSMAYPVSAFKSYSLYSGAVDAMVQWWYGHNAVGFFLTAGFLGMMYYFVPKQAERPIYSYRLSIVHFWALIATYMWAGAHHLHYSALPNWAQSVGMVMSLILLAPSWGGMINGVMTLSGAWQKLRRSHLAIPRGFAVFLRHVDL